MEYIYYDEIFTSINGETSNQGRPCTFIRFFGCNIGCSFCDQPQEAKSKKRISVGEIMTRINKAGVKYVCITGGEPLLQPNVLYPLLFELLDKGYEVDIETSGCVPIDFYEEEKRNLNRRYRYVMDIKCPSSGVSHKNVFDNLYILTCKDDLKFVIGNREDYEYARNILRSYQIYSNVLFSPMETQGKFPIAEDLVKWVVEDKLMVRIQIQSHKVIGVR